MRRLVLVAALVTVGVLATAGTSAAKKSGMFTTLAAPRGALAPGDPLELNSADLRFEHQAGAIVTCPGSTLSGQVVSNSTSGVDVTLTGAEFGAGGKGGNCEWSLFQIEVLPAGLPWTLKTGEGFEISVTSSNGQFIAAPQGEEFEACIYAGRKLVAESGITEEGASILEMPSPLAALHRSNGKSCGQPRKPRAALSGKWTMRSEGEPVKLERRV
jgi:hypothetical protein